MSIELAYRWWVVCDGCGLTLAPRTYLTAELARQDATNSGWTIHPDGTLYCDQGDHQ